MGLLRAITSVFKKTEAAVVVQKLLEHQAAARTFYDNPASYANALITAVWHQSPDIFEGKFGQRPHKLSVAAAALANGVRTLTEIEPNRQALILSLGNLLSELEVNAGFYKLNSMDHRLLTTAAAVFGQAVANLNE